MMRGVCLVACCAMGGAMVAPPGEALEATGGTTTMYKIDGQLCGQADIPSLYVGQAKSKLGLKKGSCKSKGYSHSVGSESVSVPGGGKIKVKKYTKSRRALEAVPENATDWSAIIAPPTENVAAEPETLGATGGTTTMYKIDGQLCGQADIPSLYVGQAKSKLGLKKGSCKSKGYSHSVGSESVSVPGGGKIKVKKYTKSRRALEAVPENATLSEPAEMLNTTRSCGGKLPGACKASSKVSIASWCAKYSGWSQKSCQCIAQHESGGDAHACNMNVDGSLDIGLWQINDMNWRSCSGGRAPCDPASNLACAKKTFAWGGNTWKLWSTCSKCGVCHSK